MKDNREQAHDRQRLTQHVWDLLPAAVFLKDEQGRYLTINRRSEELLDIGEAAIRGRTDHDLFATEIAAAITRNDAAVRDTGRTRTFREVVTAGGDTLELLVTKFPIPGPDGRKTYICAICTDIATLAESERAWHDAREEAERANRVKSRFLSAVSHDLRQPVQAAALFLSILQSRVAGGDKALGELGTLVDLLTSSIDSLRGMLDALLEIARLDAGSVQPTIVDLPLGEILATLGEDFRLQALRAGLDFRMVPSRSVVATDPILLERMLRALLNNAIAYTPRGRVLLGCRRRRDAVEIQVWDTGRGIAPNRLEEIFEDFVQIGNPERSRAQGLGLGLPVVARLAELLGYRVSVCSRPGRGSMFGITVPLAAPRIPARPDAATAGEDGTDLRFPGHLVLVVEDDPSVLAALRMVLETWGLRTVGAQSVDELSRQFTAIERRPSLVIADYRLPAGRTGRDAINLVRQSCAADVPAIIITGDTARERLHEALASGYPLLHKPVRVEELRDALVRLLPEEDPA